MDQQILHMRWALNPERVNSIRKIFQTECRGVILCMDLLSMSISENAAMFVSSGDVACLRGGSSLGTFLALSERIVCEWLPVIACPKLFLLPSHTSAVAFPSPLPLPLPLTPAIFFLVFISLLFSQAVHPARKKKWHQSLEVGGFFDLFMQNP